MSLFLNSNSELRSGWKFAAYIVFFLLLWIAAGVGLTMLVAPQGIWGLVGRRLQAKADAAS